MEDLIKSIAASSHCPATGLSSEPGIAASEWQTLGWMQALRLRWPRWPRHRERPTGFCKSDAAAFRLDVSCLYHFPLWHLCRHSTPPHKWIMAQNYVEDTLMYFWEGSKNAGLRTVGSAGRALVISQKVYFKRSCVVMGWQSWWGCSEYTGTTKWSGLPNPKCMMEIAA